MLNTFQDNLNFINSKKKIRLTPDFNYIELINDTCQYDYECLQLYKNIDPTIFHFNETKLNINQLKIHTGKNFLNVIIF